MNKKTKYQKSRWQHLKIILSIDVEAQCSENPFCVCTIISKSVILPAGNEGRLRVPARACSAGVCWGRSAGRVGAERLRLCASLRERLFSLCCPPPPRSPFSTFDETEELNFPYSLKIWSRHSPQNNQSMNRVDLHRYDFEMLCHHFYYSFLKYRFLFVKITLD